MLRITLLVLSLLSLTLAAPTKWYEKYSVARVIVPQSYYEVLKMRASMPPNPKAVRDVVCLDRKAHIVAHDELAASLSICGGGIEGPSSLTKTKCRDSPSETMGRFGTAMFTLRAMGRQPASNGGKDGGGGARINLTTIKWEQCVAAARGQCPTGSLSGICVGGATMGGDVGFTLVSVK